MSHMLDLTRSRPVTAQSYLVRNTNVVKEAQVVGDHLFDRGLSLAMHTSPSRASSDNRLQLTNGFSRNARICLHDTTMYIQYIYTCLFHEVNKSLLLTAYRLMITLVYEG